MGRQVGDGFPPAAFAWIERFQHTPLPREHDPVRRPRVVFHAIWHPHEAPLLFGLRVEQRKPPFLGAHFVHEGDLPVLRSVQ